MSILLFHSAGCPHCVRLVKILDQAPVKKITTDVRLVASGESPELWKKHNISSVPALVGPQGRVMVGNEAFDWVKNRMREHHLDEVALSSVQPKQFHVGNRRFVVAIGVVLAFIVASRRGLF